MYTTHRIRSYRPLAVALSLIKHASDRTQTQTHICSSIFISHNWNSINLNEERESNRTSNKAENNKTQVLQRFFYCATFKTWQHCLTIIKVTRSNLRFTRALAKFAWSNKQFTSIDRLNRADFVCIHMVSMFSHRIIFCTWIFFSSRLLSHVNATVWCKWSIR